tara:strand:+ start:20 stop:469 length:450 start_codon:yes stop_codon:yes gene_type:complete
MDNQTIKKEVENSKIRLFNYLYNTNFMEIEEGFNDKTLAEHIKETNWKEPETKPIIYGDVKSVSSSGMSRKIAFYIAKDNKIINITYLVSMILDEKEPTTNKYNNWVINVRGVGMDMVFHCIYSLGNALFRGLEKDINISGKMIQRGYL